NCYRLRIKGITAPSLISDTSACISISSCPNSITTLQPLSTTDTNAICAGSVVDVPFYAYGGYLPENTYEVELLKAEPFTTPVSIGIQPGDYAGMVQARIPDTVSVGCNYYLRVIATAPVSGPVPVIGSVWGPFCIQHCDIYFNDLQDITACLI